MHENIEQPIKKSESDGKLKIERIKEAVTEYKKGERTLILNGHSREDQGFTLFPVRNEEAGIYLGDNELISREITIEEAKTMKDSPYCTNKEAITSFLDFLEFERE